MDNNLFSLFDDPAQDDEAQNKSKGKKSPKKKTKSSAANNSDLFLFESESNEIESTKNSDNILDKEKLEENNSTEILKTDLDQTDIIEENILVEESLNVSAENSLSNTAMEEPIELTRIDSLEEKIDSEEEVLAVITELDETDFEQKIKDTTLFESQNSELESTEEAMDLPNRKDSLTIENEVEHADHIQQLDELEDNDPEVGELAHTKTEEEVTEEKLPSIEQHLLGEIISTDYTMFLDNEHDLLQLNNQKPTQHQNVITEVELDDDSSNQEVFEDVLSASLPEWTLQKKYYSIGEVAQLFEVNTSHIRFWSKEFNLRLRTTRKGDRLYTPEDIQKLRLIHELVKVKKHTIKGAKEILNTQKNKVTEKVDLKENLKELKSLLLGIHKNL